MVSPWEVYWVLQLDTFRLVMLVVGVIGFIASAIGALSSADAAQTAHSRVKRAESSPNNHYAHELAEYQQDLANAQGNNQFWRRFVVPAALATVVATALPSSRTAAAMILIPKLTSPAVLEPVGAEAKELYQLAKGALKRLATDEPKAARK